MRLPYIKVTALVLGLPMVLSSLWAKSTSDLTDVALGARVVGIGRAYSAQLGDAETVYTNVGSAGFVELPKLGYTYTSVLGEVGYYQLAGLYPTDLGVFGLSYVGTNINGSYSTSLASGQIVQGSDNYGYGSSILMLSYAKALNPGLSLGTNLKWLNQNISGGSTSAIAQGLDMDLGVNYVLNPYMRLGAAYRNLLASQLSWSGSGASAQEDIPSEFQLGLSWQCVGKDAWFHAEGVKGFFNFDTVMEQEASDPLYYAGTEIWMLDEMAFRFGLHQELEASGGATTKTLYPSVGAGLRINGLALDYGYQQNNVSGGGDTHLFTMSYVGAEAEVRYGNHINDDMGIKDKSIVYDSRQVVSGFVDHDVARLMVNDQAVQIASDGRFYVPVALNTGRNVVRLFAFNAQDQLIDAACVRVLLKSTFSDLVANYWAKDVIEDVATVGLVNGYPDGSFGPKKKITRQEITALLARSKGYDLDENQPSLFRDVSTLAWSKQYINAAFTNGLVTGYPDKTFKPKRNLSRAESVTMFVRFQGEENPENVFTNPFWDVPLNHWATPYVLTAREKGLVEGYPDGSFQLGRNIIRSEAVQVLSNTQYGQQRILELYDWDTYLTPEDTQIINDILQKRDA